MAFHAVAKSYFTIMSLIKSVAEDVEGHLCVVTFLARAYQIEG
jgi:hypothetical protein